MKQKDVNERAVNELAGAKNKMQTFDEVLKNKEYQAEFDRRIQKAIKTVTTKWKVEKEEQRNSKISEKKNIVITFHNTPTNLKIII